MHPGDPGQQRLPGRGVDRLPGPESDDQGQQPAQRRQRSQQQAAAKLTDAGEHQQAAAVSLIDQPANHRGKQQQWQQAGQQQRDDRPCVVAGGLQVQHQGDQRYLIAEQRHGPGSDHQAKIASAGRCEGHTSKLILQIWPVKGA